MEEAIIRCKRNFVTLNGWAAIPGALKLYYDDLAFDQRRTARVIARHLGVKLDADAVARHMADAHTQMNKGQRARWKHDLTPAQQAQLTTEFAPMLQQIGKERGFVRRAMRRLVT